MGTAKTAQSAYGKFKRGPGGTLAAQREERPSLPPDQSGAARDGRKPEERGVREVTQSKCFEEGVDNSVKCCQEGK